MKFDMKNVTPANYAKATEQMIRIGRSLDELNRANHIALEKHLITMEHFTAAAKVLAAEIMKR